MVSSPQRVLLVFTLIPFLIIIIHFILSVFSHITYMTLGLCVDMTISLCFLVLSDDQTSPAPSPLIHQRPTSTTTEFHIFYKDRVSYLYKGRAYIFAIHECNSMANDTDIDYSNYYQITVIITLISFTFTVLLCVI